MSFDWGEFFDPMYRLWSHRLRYMYMEFFMLMHNGLFMLRGLFELCRLISSKKLSIFQNAFPFAKVSSSLDSYFGSVSAIVEAGFETLRGVSSYWRTNPHSYSNMSCGRHA